MSDEFAYNDSVFSLSPTLVPVETQDSRSLLERARAGDCEAFSEICRQYETRFFRQAMTLCGNSTLAEDLTQDTLVEAWRSLRRFNGKCQFFTWLCAILLNRFRNTLRQKPFQSIDENQWAAQPDNNAGPDQILATGEQAALVRSCIASLSPKHQEVIFLRFYVDDSLVEIAAALGCSVGTVKSRLFHALENLRALNMNL